MAVGNSSEELFSYLANFMMRCDRQTYWTRAVRIADAEST